MRKAMAHLAMGLLEVLQDDERNERQQQWQGMMGPGGPHVPVGPHAGQMIGPPTGPPLQMIGGLPQHMQQHGGMPMARPMMPPGALMEPRPVAPMPAPGHMMGNPQLPHAMMAGPPGPGPGVCRPGRPVTPIVTEMPSPEPERRPRRLPSPLIRPRSETGTTSEAESKAESKAAAMTAAKSTCPGLAPKAAGPGPRSDETVTVAPRYRHRSSSVGLSGSEAGHRGGDRPAASAVPEPAEPPRHSGSLPSSASRPAVPEPEGSPPRRRPTHDESEGALGTIQYIFVSKQL